MTSSESTSNGLATQTTQTTPAAPDTSSVPASETADKIAGTMPENEGQGAQTASTAPPPNLSPNLPPNLPPIPPSDSAPQTMTKPPSASSFNIWVLIAIAALALAGWQWWESRSRLNHIQADVAKRLSENTQSVHDMQTTTREAKQSLFSATTRLDNLEAMVNESRSQHRALESLYQDIVRTRDDNTLLEVERALVIAAQQLQLSGNVQAALNALQAADSRLAAVNRPSWLLLRKALNQDIDHLKSLPFVDIAGINLRLENILVLSDKFPLNAESRPQPEQTVGHQEAAKDEANSGWQNWGGRFVKEFWGELKGMVRIQRFDQKDQQVLLAPGQDFFLRENLKLRLLNARLALLSHDYSTFRNDLTVAHDWLNRFYDNRDIRVETAKTQLQELTKTQVVFELPTLGGSFAALKTAEADNTSSANTAAPAAPTTPSTHTPAKSSGNSNSNPAQQAKP